MLDEPNANLDSEGEAALLQAIRDAKARGAIVIMIAHRAGALAVCDKVLLLQGRAATGVRSARRGAAQVGAAAVQPGFQPAAQPAAASSMTASLKIVGDTAPGGKR